MLNSSSVVNKQQCYSVLQRTALFAFLKKKRSKLWNYQGSSQTIVPRQCKTIFASLLWPKLYKKCFSAGRSHCDKLLRWSQGISYPRHTHTSTCYTVLSVKRLCCSTLHFPFSLPPEEKKKNLLCKIKIILNN